MARIAAAIVAVAVLAVASMGPAAAEDPATDEAATDDAVIRSEEGELVRLYRAVLGRTPDRTGYEYWVGRRLDGVTLAVVADSFLASDEYRRRFGAATDSAFLDLVYRNVLGREGDPSGLAYWSAELAVGLDRADLVLLFSESTEFRRRTGTVLPELPPFEAVVRPVDADSLGRSWRPGCPVDPGDLRAVEVDHVGYDGGHRRGTVIVHEAVVEEVVAVLASLYEVRFPIASLRPVDEFEGDDDASMEANNSSAFNCRAITGGTRWSRHAYGTAFDLNPVQNPYVSGEVVLPPAGVDHLDRSGYQPGAIRPAGAVVEAFAAVGWRWGGDFTSLRDYQHFDRPTVPSAAAR